MPEIDVEQFKSYLSRQAEKEYNFLSEMAQHKRSKDILCEHYGVMATLRTIYHMIDNGDFDVKKEGE